MKRLLAWLEYWKQLRDIRRTRTSFWHGWDEIPVTQQAETTFPCERIGAGRVKGSGFPQRPANSSSERGAEAIVPQPPTGPTSVYRYYDARGVLIYVGITSRGTGRNTEHNKNAEWWPYVTNQEVEHLDTRHQALQRELELIVAFRPPFNKQHNPDYLPLRAAYEAYVESVAHLPTNPRALVEALGRRLPLASVGYDPGDEVTSPRVTMQVPPHAFPLVPTLTMPRQVYVYDQGDRKIGAVQDFTKAPSGAAVFVIKGNRARPIKSGYALLGILHQKRNGLITIIKKLHVELDRH